MINAAVPIAPSLRSRLTGDGNLLRAALLDCLLAAAAPVPFAAAGAALGWPAARTDAAAEDILAQKLAVLDAASCVQIAYPVSALPTAHQVTLPGGRRFYAMCAIDALGACAEFGQPVHVVSTCQQCGAPIDVMVGAPAAPAAADSFVATPPTIYAVHMDLAKYADWATKT
jgi:hypothetical protein